MVCEMFNCTPSVAIRELEETPFGLIAAIAEVRAYRAALQQVEEQEHNPRAQIEETAMMRVVRDSSSSLLVASAQAMAMECSTVSSSSCRRRAISLHLRSVMSFQRINLPFNKPYSSFRGVLRTSYVRSTPATSRHISWGSSIRSG